MDYNEKLKPWPYVPEEDLAKWLTPTIELVQACAKPALIKGQDDLLRFGNPWALLRNHHRYSQLFRMHLMTEPDQNGEVDWFGTVLDRGVGRFVQLVLLGHTHASLESYLRRCLQPEPKSLLEKTLNRVLQFCHYMVDQPKLLTIIPQYASDVRTFGWTDLVVDHEPKRYHDTWPSYCALHDAAVVSDTALTRVREHEVQNQETGLKKSIKPISGAERVREDLIRFLKPAEVIKVQEHYYRLIESTKTVAEAAIAEPAKKFIHVDGRLYRQMESPPEDEPEVNRSFGTPGYLLPGRALHDTTITGRTPTQPVWQEIEKKTQHYKKLARDTGVPVLLPLGKEVSLQKLVEEELTTVDMMRGPSLNHWFQQVDKKLLRNDLLSPRFEQIAELLFKESDHRLYDQTGKCGWILRSLVSQKSATGPDRHTLEFELYNFYPCDGHGPELVGCGILGVVATLDYRDGQLYYSWKCLTDTCPNHGEEKWFMAPSALPRNCTTEGLIIFLVKMLHRKILKVRG